MKKDENVETNEKKEGKVKAFFKRNGKKVAIIAGGAVLAVVGAAAIVISGKGTEEESEAEPESDDFEDEPDENFKAFARCAKHVDEDIFTSIAPAIEHIVLNDGTGVIKKTYDFGGRQTTVKVDISSESED